MIEIFNENGEVREYLTVAERVSEFLEHYGPETGYVIRIRALNFFDMHQDVASLFKAAIGARSSVSVLPAIDLTLFRFDAQLIDKDGRIVAEASALRRINTDLDATFYARLWEAGETAAFQRLMARVGFGSDTLLKDEMNDMNERGLNYVQKGEAERIERVANVVDQVVEDDTPKPARPPEPPQRVTSIEAVEPEGDGDDAKVVGEAQPEAAPTPPASAKPNTERLEAGSGAEVSDALLRQIRHLASVRGIEPPEVSTKAEAKEALKKLRATPAAQ